jgi:hypothetical protein
MRWKPLRANVFTASDKVHGGLARHDDVILTEVGAQVREVRARGGGDRHDAAGCALSQPIRDVSRPGHQGERQRWREAEIGAQRGILRVEGERAITLRTRRPPRR